MRRSRTPGWLLAATALALLLARVAWGWLAAPLPALHVAGEIRASWFAVGDSGWTGRLHRGQKHVADAIDALDREQPADGLLMLGDNFYPNGLRADDLEGNLLAAVVRPFCPFAELTENWIVEPPRCERPGGRRREIWAVLGNHDHESAESPLLQRAWIETRISNWRMPEGAVTRYALAPGVDLLAYDSHRLMEGADAALLTAALRAAPGPWRIVAAHHPLRMDWEPADVRAEAEKVRRAIAAAGVPVQLAVAGHEHNLQVLDLEEPLLGLQIVVGSGSRHRPVRGDLPGRLLGVEELGFARLALVEDPEARLRVTLFSVSSGPFPSSWPRLWPAQPRAEATFEIDAEGGFSRSDAS